MNINKITAKKAINITTIPINRIIDQKFLVYSFRLFSSAIGNLFHDFVELCQNEAIV